eukprot:TRINITY_DN1737_c0_g1_i3.p1 TRINITY_DN1737_c0_g1~~TRINITY_DN1737_c0_g1_i3.p1  ORF type:complete len:400 (+),score=9.29 TRINITY_DN1737_c0_g1_i3:88-1287(+)
MSLSVVLDKLEEMQKPYASTVDGFKSATRASENQSATIRELLSRLGDAQEERRTAVLSVDQLRTSLANSQAETKLWRHAYMCERRRQHAAAVRYGAHQAAQGMKVDAVEDRVSSSDDDGRSVASECPCPECPGASARCQGQEYTKGSPDGRWTGAPSPQWYGRARIVKACIGILIRILITYCVLVFLTSLLVTVSSSRSYEFANSVSMIQPVRMDSDGCMKIDGNAVPAGPLWQMSVAREIFGGRGVRHFSALLPYIPPPVTSGQIVSSAPIFTQTLRVIWANLVGDPESIREGRVFADPRTLPSMPEGYERKTYSTSQVQKSSIFADLIGAMFGIDTFSSLYMLLLEFVFVRCSRSTLTGHAAQMGMILMFISYIAQLGWGVVQRIWSVVRRVGRPPD